MKSKIWVGIIALLLVSAEVDAQSPRKYYVDSNGVVHSSGLDQFTAPVTASKCVQTSVDGLSLQLSAASCGGAGAPATSTYIVQVPDGALTNAQALSVLSTGLLIGTTGTGVVSSYGGVSCTNQFLRALGASGAGTCNMVQNTDLVNSSVMLNGASLALGGSRTLLLASSDFVNQGSTTTVLHGNAAGNPSFSAVSLVNDVTGTLVIGSGGTGQTTKAAAFDALQPMTTGGDLIYGGISGTGTRLANGVSGQVLQSNGTTIAPSWLTPNTTLVGTTTNDSAVAGNIGELLISAVNSGSAVPLSTGVVTAVTSLSLTAGDWDVSGFVGFVTGTGTATTLLAGNISTVSGQSPSADGGARFPVNLTWATGEGIIFVLAPVRVSLAATTTYYLNEISNFSVSTLKGYGTVRARRMR